MAALRLLPLELLSYIAQYNDNHDQTILACVSRAFNVETNRVLYASVHISVERAARNFARTLTERPELAALVRALNISLPAVGDYQDIDLSGFVHLRHLNITTLFHPSHFLNRLRDDQLRSLELSYTWLRSSRNLACFLGRQRQLTRLSLDESCKIGLNDLPRLQALECPPLFAIALGPGRPVQDVTILGTLDDSFLKNLLAALPSCVQSLNVNLDENHVHHLAAIARALPDLETLKLNNVVLDDFDAISTSNDLPRFPMLRNLHLQLYSDYDFEFDTVLPNCRTLYVNWKKSSPLLEHLDVSFEDYQHLSTYTVESADGGADSQVPRAR